MTLTDSGSRPRSVLTPSALAREAERFRFIARRLAAFGDEKPAKRARAQARLFEQLSNAQERPA